MEEYRNVGVCQGIAEHARPYIIINVRIYLDWTTGHPKTGVPIPSPLNSISNTAYSWRLKAHCWSMSGDIKNLRPLLPFYFLRSMKVILRSKSNFASKFGCPYLVLKLRFYLMLISDVRALITWAWQVIKNLRPLLFMKLVEFYKFHFGTEVNFSLYHKIPFEDFQMSSPCISWGLWIYCTIVLKIKTQLS